MEGHITGYWDDHGAHKWIIAVHGGEALDVFALEKDLEPDSIGRGLDVTFDLSPDDCRGMFRAINVKCIREDTFLDEVDEP
jgi:hypothetical protein